MFIPRVAPSSGLVRLGHVGGHTHQESLLKTRSAVVMQVLKYEPPPERWGRVQSVRPNFEISALATHVHVHTAPSSELVQLGHVGTHSQGEPPENTVCSSYASFEMSPPERWGRVQSVRPNFEISARGAFSCLRGYDSGVGSVC